MVARVAEHALGDQPELIASTTDVLRSLTDAAGDQPEIIASTTDVVSGH